MLVSGISQGSGVGWLGFCAGAPRGLQIKVVGAAYI